MDIGDITTLQSLDGKATNFREKAISSEDNERKNLKEIKICSLKLTIKFFYKNSYTEILPKLRETHDEHLR